MKIDEIKKLEERYYANTFSRLPLAAEKGEGMYLFDVEGRRYLDMFAGIAVNSLGHAHPRLTEAIRKQAEKLMHTSNWLYTLPQLELARLLVELTGMEKAFLTNDGTEAVEAAIKLARKVTGKKEIIAMEKAFHGRSFGALSLTWEDKYKEPFKPLVPGMRFAKYDDIKSLEEQMTEDTAAVILEPVQGEAGVIMPKAGYLEAVRRLTEEKNVLLIIDEVQTGFGRTGKMFAFQHSGIKPDIVCMAKGMGGGFPIGAIAYRCGDFEPGQHGGTFIGSPLACAAAAEVIKTIMDEDIVKNAEKMGSYLLSELQKRGLDAWGMGLMVGFKAACGKKTVLDLIEKKVLTICSGNTVRILPALNIEKKHVDEFLVALDSIEVQDG